MASMFCSWQNGVHGIIRRNALVYFMKHPCVFASRKEVSQSYVARDPFCHLATRRLEQQVAKYSSTNRACGSMNHCKQRGFRFSSYVCARVDDQPHDRNMLTIRIMFFGSYRLNKSNGYGFKPSAFSSKRFLGLQSSPGFLNRYGCSYPLSMQFTYRRHFYLVCLSFLRGLHAVCWNNDCFPNTLLLSWEKYARCGAHYNLKRTPFICVTSQCTSFSARF